MSCHDIMRHRKTQSSTVIVSPRLLGLLVSCGSGSIGAQLGAGSCFSSHRTRALHTAAKSGTSPSLGYTHGLFPPTCKKIPPRPSRKESANSCEPEAPPDTPLSKADIFYKIPDAEAIVQTFSLYGYYHSHMDCEDESFLISSLQWSAV